MALNDSFGEKYTKKITTRYSSHDSRAYNMPARITTPDSSHNGENNQNVSKKYLLINKKCSILTDRGEKLTNH